MAYCEPILNRLKVKMLTISVWLSWNQWTECSVSCGPGIRRRVRVCNSQQDPNTYTGRCTGPDEETGQCVETQFCPCK